MAMASASLLLPSLNPKTLSLCNTKPVSFSVSALSQKIVTKSIPIISFVGLSKSSRFTPNVAVSSEFDQEEGIFSGDDGEVDARSFSPDLKLFVGNIPFTVDSAQLAGLFATAGNVEMVEVIYDKVSGRSRGFGFVTMSTAEEVEAAAQQFNGYELEGRALRVNSGPPPAKREVSSPRGGFRGAPSFESSNRLYVGNLSWGVDDLALENLFSEQGKVVEAKVVYDRDSGRSRGFGFVTYSSAEEVNNALDSLNGVDLDGRPIRVSVAESRPRRSF